MNSQRPDSPDEFVDGSVVPAGSGRRISRRASVIGTLIALLIVVGVGYLAWRLTQPQAPASAPGAAGRAPGAGPGGAPAAGGPGGGAGGRGGAATTVGVAAAEVASIPVLLEALGTAVPQATVRVRPQVSGVLQQVLFKEGQNVRRGELLAVIDPRQFEMAVQQASGQRMRDEAQLEAARVTLQRFRTLLQQDSIARQEVDTQEALVKQLEAAVVISKANEGTARLNLGYTRISAPIAGRVGLRTVDVGNVVNASDANGVALITQVAPIDVEFAVPQDQAAALQRNTGTPMPVQALDRTRSTVLDSGVFASLDNQVDVQTGTVRAKARFGNAQLQLFPSQFVNVRLQLRTIEDAVMVPVAAVRNGPAGDFVFVLNEDRTVSVRPVTRGQATVDKVQIASGLEVGERVITEGADRLREGSRVSLAGDAQRGPGAGPGSGRRQRANGPADGPIPSAPGGTAPVAPGTRPAPGAAQPGPGSTAPAPRVNAPDPALPSAAGAPKITPQERQRFLDSAQGDPQALERRTRLLEAVERGDPAAVERWQAIRERRRQAGGAAP